MMVKDKIVGGLGLSSLIIFLFAFLIFGFLNSEFSFLHDYISMLGAKGEPQALFFNIIGFILVGLLQCVFGLLYGNLLNDKLLSVLLSFFGLGFAFAAIPVDLEATDPPFSKAHILAICLGLAFWLFGLARLGHNKKLPKKIRNRANVTATLLIIIMIGASRELWPMPITHRLIFGIVFGWTALTSLELITKDGLRKI